MEGKEGVKRAGKRLVCIERTRHPYGVSSIYGDRDEIPTWWDRFVFAIFPGTLMKVVEGEVWVHVPSGWILADKFF